MKKAIAFVLSICLTASLTACAAGGAVNTPQETSAAVAQSSTAAETKSAETEETAEAKETVEADETIADLVVYGTVYTAEDGGRELAEAFAVKDGKYIFVGDKADAAAYVKDGQTEVIDRTGEGMIIPGCTEGHSHYFGAYGIQTILPGSNRSYKEMLEILKDEVANSGITQFVTFGWNGQEINGDRDLGKSFAEEIESIAPGIPVVLQDNTGHNAVCNITALEKAGLLEKPEVRGGEVYLDKNGKPSGYISDQAVAYVVEHAIQKPLSDEKYQEAAVIAAGMLNKLGFTNALDAWTNLYDQSAMYETLNTLDESGKLTINVAACYNIKSYDAGRYKARVDEVADLTDRYRSAHFNPAFIKLFADGVVDGGTGWMSEPYRNVPKGKEYGNQIWKPEELNALVTYANSKNILVHTHSYGDAATTTMLDTYIASNQANGKEYRNCLGHVRNIQPEDIIRAAENKIPIAENLIWHVDYDDKDPKQAKTKEHIQNMLPENAYYSGYPMKSLVEKGVMMTSSTDAPAAMFVEGNVMNIIEVAVTGITPHESGQAFAENELLTINEALQALTINGAWQLGLEEERGSVKVGKYADFLILDKNILDYEGKELRTIGDTRILNTYFEGKNVYTADIQEVAEREPERTEPKKAGVPFDMSADPYGDVESHIIGLHGGEVKMLEYCDSMYANTYAGCLNCGIEVMHCDFIERAKSGVKKVSSADDIESCFIFTDNHSCNHIPDIINLTPGDHVKCTYADISQEDGVVYAVKQEDLYTCDEDGKPTVPAEGWESVTQYVIDPETSFELGFVNILYYYDEPQYIRVAEYTYD